MILRGGRGIHAFGGNMATTNKLSDYYILAKLDVKDEDSYYSKLELITTANLSSDSAEYSGIQARLFSGFQNSLSAAEFDGYPVETVIRISSKSEEYAVQVFGGNSSSMFYDVPAVHKLMRLFDTTASNNFKLFSGFDGRRWDFIADMDAIKAVLYIKNSVNPLMMLRYLKPFVSEGKQKRDIALAIKKKQKARVH